MNSFVFMKAVVYRKYGSPEVLKVEDAMKPVPKDNEVLVKIHAASINSWDSEMLRGKPYITRMWGLFKPKYIIPGCDLAGVVESVGEKVTLFKPGDRVFADACESGFGAMAEYKCVDEKVLTKIPDKLSFEEAS